MQPNQNTGVSLLWCTYYKFLEELNEYYTIQIALFYNVKI